MPEKKNSRREFLRTMAAGTTAAAFPYSPVAASAGPRVDANDRVTVAVMGTNGRGRGLARGFARLAGVEVAFICDVDQRAIEKGREAVTEGGGKSPQGERDFRRVLENRDVDALVIAAPNHWHAPAAILACQAGKHVYVEKPCSHTPREGELLVAAARKHKRLVQMGNQRRSYPLMMEAIEQLRGGVIGRVYYSRSGYANKRPSIGHGKAADAPSWLDYELWQGPAPRMSFRDNLIHYNWHWFWHWGNGEAGNNGVHSIDLCRWGLGVDYPVRVTSLGGRYHWNDDQETPDTQTITFEFEGERSIFWEGLSCSGSGARFEGISFHGEKGVLVYADGGYRIYDLDGKVVKDQKDADRSGDGSHLGNFVESIRGKAKLNSEIEEGHKSTLLCHLGNIALRTGRVLSCDPKDGKIRNDPAAMQQWSKEYAPGWEPKV